MEKVSVSLFCRLWVKQSLFVLAFCLVGMELYQVFPSEHKILVGLVWFVMGTGLAIYLVGHVQLILIASLTFWASELAYHYDHESLDVLLTTLFYVQRAYLVYVQCRLLQLDGALK